MKRLTIYPTARTSIEIIPQKRMATGSHVHTDLMRAACFQAKGEKRHIRRCAQALPSCHGTLSIRPDASLDAVARQKTDASLFHPLSAQIAAAQSDVLLSDSSCQAGCRKGILSQHNQSGGIPIQTVNGMKLQRPPRARGDGPAQHLPGCPDHGRGTDKPAWHWAFPRQAGFHLQTRRKGGSPAVPPHRETVRWKKRRNPRFSGRCAPWPVSRCTEGRLLSAWPP